MRTAIVGTGKVAGMHAGALRSLSAAQLVAVCGRDADKTERFAAQWQATAYTDVERMVREQGIELVLIATPHPQHAAPTIAACMAGAHVLVEKPLAATLADCDRMLAAGKAAGVTIGTICQRRFYEPCQRLKAALDAGRLGRPALASVTLFGWRDESYYRSDPWRGSWQGEGGGVLVNQAPHHLDLLHWYLGEIEEVSAGCANVNHPSIEVEDTSAALIRFRNGALASVLVSNAQNPALHGRITIHGSNGATAGVQTDGGAMFLAGQTAGVQPPYHHVWTVPGDEDKVAGWQQEDAAAFSLGDVSERYHALLIEEFIASIRSGRPPLVTGEDGRRTVELFTAIYEAQRTRSVVRLPLPARSSAEEISARSAIWDQA
jgi:UDP-N-acetyl-2-amino-2-deoxyglucuronate dehydrogenase